VKRDRNRGREREEADGDRGLRAPERDVDERLVEADQEPRDGVLLLGPDLSADEEVLERRREGARTRAEVEVWCEKSDGTKTAVGTGSALEL